MAQSTASFDPTRRALLTAGIPATLLTMTGVTLGQDHGQGAHGAGRPTGKLAELFRSLWADGQYKLPPLPYAPDALEPHIDRQTMELHHGRHHNAYVTGINNALKKLGELKGADVEPGAVEGLQRDISFNLGGHIMHTLFWGIMGPNAGGQPQGPVGEAITKTFQSFDNFKAYFTKVALSVKGSGWAVLAYDPFGRQLVTYAMGDQDTRLVSGAIPLLAVDVWEHAYYLKYQNRRAEYVNAWFNTIDWQAVNELYASHQHPLGG